MRPYKIMYDSSKHHRRSVRLEGHDYASAGWYFLTICAARRGEIFGRVVDNGVVLNRFGRIIQEQWSRVGAMREEVTLDEWIVMPDHLHAIVAIQHSAPQDETISPRAARSLASLVAGFKSAVTSRINTVREQRTQVWQRNYWEHIIRDERDLNNTRRYILENPQRWTIRNMNQP